MSPAPAPDKHPRGSDDLILRHCTVLEAHPAGREPARTRLEEALGPALAQRLVSSLSLTRRVARA